MHPGNASVDGSEQFMQTSNCHPWLMAIFEVKEDGLIQAGVMNTLDQPIMIQSGQQYGQVTLTLTFNPPVGSHTQMWTLCTFQTFAKVHFNLAETFKQKGQLQKCIFNTKVYLFATSVYH
jgi:hypothetical protein